MNTRDEWSAEEQRLHDALQHTAEQVTPGPDGLAQIRRRTSQEVTWWRRPVLFGLVGASAVAAAIIVGGVAIFGEDDPIVATGPPSDSASSADADPSEQGVASPEGSSAPPEDGESGEDEATREISVPVYYAADNGDGNRLTREFRTVETNASPVTAAVSMLAEPAMDPDYDSFWSSDLDVRSTAVTEGTIEVELETAPPADGPAGDDARVAMQQLVYTATAAASMHDAGDASDVRVTVDGQPLPELFGESDLAEPVSRAEPLEIRQLVQIDTPTEGENVTAPVTVNGSGAAFEATLQWEILADGEVVASDTTTAEECCTMSPFEFEVDLDPGTYELVVSEVDVSDGEGRSPASDSKTFTVE